MTFPGCTLAAPRRVIYGLPGSPLRSPRFGHGSGPVGSWNVPSSLAAAAGDALKFSSMLPPALATEVVQRRLSAEGSVRVVLDEPVSAYSV